MSETVSLKMKGGKGAAAIKYMMALSRKVREMNRAACDRAAVARFQKAGLDVSSAARLTVLNNAMKTESLNPVVTRALPHIEESTIRTINSLEQISRGKPRIEVSNKEITDALSLMTKSVKIGHEAYMIEEQRKTVDDLAVTLKNRGYDIQNHTLPSKEIWVKAHKGEHIVAARVHPSAGIALDLGGFNPGGMHQRAGGDNG